MRATSVESETYYTIGHSVHDLEAFRLLLLGHQIDCLVDVRSTPFSKQAPQFNRDSLQRFLAETGVSYLYTGGELGGRPPEAELYAPDGRVLYWKLARQPRFLKGIETLSGLNQGGSRLALMCSEENPQNCHRRLLIGRVLQQNGAKLLHIRGNGHADEETGMVASQRSLFDGGEEPAWKSIQSVLPKRAPASSSAH